VMEAETRQASVITEDDEATTYDVLIKPVFNVEMQAKPKKKKGRVAESGPRR